MVSALGKMGLDFLASPGRGVSMDDHTDDLIAQLCTRIGMIMEDASVTALTVGGKSPDNRKAAIDELDGAAKRIDALVTAVRAAPSLGQLCSTVRERQVIELNTK